MIKYVIFTIKIIIFIILKKWVLYINKIYVLNKYKKINKVYYKKHTYFFSYNNENFKNYI